MTYEYWLNIINIYQIKKSEKHKKISHEMTHLMTISERTKYSHADCKIDLIDLINKFNRFN